MTTATTSRPTPRTPWTSHSQARSHQKPSTTPSGVPTRTPGSVGQSGPPRLSAKARSPFKQHNPRTPSPNYFEFVVEAGNNAADSTAAGHVKKNWSPPSSSVRSTAAVSPRTIPLDANPEFEAFRRQSESHAFSLSHGNLSHFSQGSGTGTFPTLGSLAALKSPTSAAASPKFSSQDTSNRMNLDTADDSMNAASWPSEYNPIPNGSPSFFEIPRNESPANTTSLERPPVRRDQLSHLDNRHPRLSLPHNRIDPPTPPASHHHHAHRAETLPSSLSHGGPTMISPQDVVELLKSTPLQEILLLDLRVSPQYTQSRISGAINLCIPTTLLKRPSFNVQKLTETFTKEQEKEKFSHWKETNYIIVYDASSAQLKDATSSVNTLKKFTNEGWHGTSLVIRGGFLDFSRKVPDLVDRRRSNDTDNANKSHLSIDSQMSGAMPVAGGCPMPSTKMAANPFFGNIRQNMDLIGGVGQISVQYPSSLTEVAIDELPKWIREASDENNKGKIIADRFLGIEKAEQERMQKALSGNVSYGTPAPGSARSVQIAGIEKGTKNRYKDILPYDHSRVRLQNVPSGGCDYVNASHIKAEWSHRHYLATQAPVPATFEDFWRVVWEQDARVIVMLTAEAEGGQRKSHPYWLPNEYGPFKLKALSEKRVSLEPSSMLSPNSKIASPSVKSPTSDRPSMGHRRSTNPYTVSERSMLREAALSPTSELPHVIVRKLTLSHASQAFEPLREITQLQYSSWPDFGAPAHPAHVLALVEHCDAIIRSYSGAPRTSSNMPAKEGERPVVVHCSAGCGRTGTFCTVDSVVDMLKRQRMVGQEETRHDPSCDEMDIDDEEWVKSDDVDLIAKAVEDFRLQRLSMVQTLRQFVLCYESVLEWLAKEMPDRIKKESVRRSYQG